MSRKRAAGLPVLISELAIALAVTALPAASPPTWPPISAEDAAMKECPQQPGAPAVFLFSRLKLCPNCAQKMSGISKHI